MDSKTIGKISKNISRRFPDVGGRPKIQRQNSPQAKGRDATPTYLLIYKGQAEGPGGKTFSRRVRVVADAKGKIIKVSTSR
jgi:hypothetical protein